MHMKKNNDSKRYTVLKLKSDDGFTFYTTSYKKEDFNQKRLRVQMFPNERISFIEYLGTFYVKSKIKHQQKLPVTFKDYFELSISFHRYSLMCYEECNTVVRLVIKFFFQGIIYE